MYVGGVDESSTDSANGNLVLPSILAARQALFTAFLNETNQTTGSVLDYDAKMVVTHITARDAEDHPIAGVATDVSQLILDSRFATQRRRLRG